MPNQGNEATVEANGKKARLPKFAIVSADDVFQVFVEEPSKYAVEKDPQLNETAKDWPVADHVLIALRQAYSLTYAPRVDSANDDSKVRLEKIRELCARALRGFSKELKALRLPEVGVDPDQEKPGCIFKYMVAPLSKLKARVINADTNEKVPLIELIDWHPADAAIEGCRKVLSTTFEEAFKADDYSRIFAKIRKLSAITVEPYNGILEEIEIEPVALPRRYGDEHLAK